MTPALISQVEVGFLMLLLSAGVQMGIFLWQRKRLRQEKTQSQMPQDLSSIHTKIALLEEKQEQHGTTLEQHGTRLDATRGYVERIRGRLRMNGGDIGD